MTDNIYDLVLNAVKSSQCAFCRYITANDTGGTGSHQYGFYIPKYASEFLFDVPGKKGELKDKNVIIKWQNSFETQSRVLYYGVGTRKEYRITRFGKNFPFLTDDNIGSLLVMTKEDEEYYQAYVLSDDNDIESFFAYFDYSPENPCLIKSGNDESVLLNDYLLPVVDRMEDFPATEIMAIEAQNAVAGALRLGTSYISSHPDEMILKWIGTEYVLFKLLENKIYAPVISVPFKDCQSLIDFSNTILNRRKSRAGKSLEHHLSKIFSASKLRYDSQVITEDNKKPDFIFPGGKEYHDGAFPSDKLIFLGAKTTCKDRWRQVLNEADRIGRKYLFTLQQGVSSNQLKEMRHENLTLVVPAPYKKYFSPKYHKDILTLKKFIEIVHSTQN